MRLSKIKLAGFKSFVDPTILHLPTNIVGVVGPNGCGKSNIIDAVRWVMGESSARHLRGEQMSDVIFNGSSARKPVGTATVELVFDNSDGAIGGQYANYNEISVKRVLGRDGQSQYYLNNARCRRRDITDIFMGTGLGPRSYSVIEQGMISHIVDARPEELRVYLEEAAGISKYKERRRETENRIRHTRENLERLNDLREEVAKHLQRLQRQAKAAEKYKALKEEERGKKAELLALRWRELEHDAEARQRTLNERQTELEQHVAEQRRHEAAVADAREEHAGATETYNHAQNELYRVGSEVARLEQNIQHQEEMKRRQEQDLQETERGLGEIQEQRQIDQVQLEELRNRLAELEPALETARERETETESQRADAEQSMQAWRERWDEHSRNLAEQNRLAEVERARIDQLDRHISQLAQRLEEIDAETSQLDTGELEREIAELQEQAESVQTEEASLAERVEAAKTELTQREAEVAEASTALDQVRQELQTKRGRLSSLEALQQAALGQDQDAEGGPGQWLAERGLDQARRLAQALDVDDGWQAAVETVLGGYLDAVLTDNAVDYLDSLAELGEGSVALVDAGGEHTRADGERLAAHVTGPAAIASLLHGVYTAADLERARALLPQLGPGESAITARGEWLGPGWVRVARGEGDQAGVLAREEEINALRARVEELERRSESLSEQLEAAREAVTELTHRRDDLQAEHNMQHRRYSEVSGQLQSKQARLEHLQKRSQELSGERERAREQMEAEESNVKAARGRLEQAIAAIDELSERSRSLEQERERLQADLERVREAAREARDEAQQIALEVEAKRSALQSTEQALQRLDSQHEQLDTRRGQLREQLAGADDPIAEQREQLKTKLDERLAAERRVSEAKTALDQIDERVRDLEGKRQQAEKQAASVREQVEADRLALERARVQTQHLAEQISETGIARDEVLARLPEQADPQSWEQELERLGDQLRRLEPVNLAAIEEHAEEQERKKYLDEQDADLQRALATLEEAIDKIDRQTRTRFKETFDRVNHNLQELFPRLFGGGHAYLQLTSEDLLSSGVAIMARPPGKRVVHIHLLSGGEKALTAVALVFAIFRLNPAPFCLLDEVDAPLDDANVGRFSDLVQEMAQSVQFLFVSHNKITIEIAHQLAGVTMREPGVSRMVSVDVDEAAELAAM